MKVVFNIIKYFNYIIAAIILSVVFYIKNFFNDMSFDQLLFTFLNSENVGLKSLKKDIIIVLLVFILILFIELIIDLIYSKLVKIFKEKRNEYCTYLEIKNKKYLFSPLNVFFLSLISLYFSTTIAMDKLHINEFLKNQKSYTKIYEEYYVDPKDVNIEFKEKRNLIYIYLESTENTFMSKENGGIMDNSYIPNLEKLSNTYTNFSNTDKIGGAKVLDNSAWTIAAMVSQTSGIPLTIPIAQNDYTSYDSFLSGTKALGDILEENGYKNYLMIGSSASFGGRDKYFKTHGNYTIYDYDYAYNNNIVDYKVWWGYEDKKLIELAKESLLKISEKDEPFNFTLLTVDTHFTDGYLDETCKYKPFIDQYANVFYCSDKLINEFIKWIQEQPFYENTTIILSGDHLTMQKMNLDISDSDRTTYNTFINSYVSTENTKNRDFTTLDLFPTTLASIGATIEGDRLGLGTNLFSDKKTLSEELGYTYLNDETKKKSLYYNNKLLKDDYYNMVD